MEMSGEQISGNGVQQQSVLKVKTGSHQHKNSSSSLGFTEVTQGE